MIDEDGGSSHFVSLSIESAIDSFIDLSLVNQLQGYLLYN